MQYEAIIKDRKSFGPLSRILVVADSKVEAEEFARRAYSDRFLELKELD
ncbi:hypothetical protein CHCC14600_4268 [Bacillus licheniformis]|nr:MULTISPECIES: hypothetical protein [Bacillus]ARW41649.1 hypothetical protein S100141_00326 [Bacillus licheniformis]MCA1182416.1 hypothetical protein [Bacillus licheniformis]MEC0474926.1 hypothetical protein [Bacillus licheniformis]MEC3606250.1 hypothetical protein [Bacillus glycinifermentans]TWK91186.1 hypothetical protein CHCC20327_2563 [Bacillus licheniformis]